MMASARSIDSVFEALDWSSEGIGAFSERERLAPFLYEGLKRRGWPGVIPHPERRALRRGYYQSAGLNVELLAALSDFTQALARRNVRLVALKGADLATRLYPNVALRPMSDVDVYVAPADVDTATEVLAAMGYTPWCPEMGQGLDRLAHHGRLFVGGPTKLQVDLHWSLVGGETDRRAAGASWIEANVECDADLAWMHLEPTAHLLYLSAHMKLQHAEDDIPLLWLIDFYLLATSGTIRWDRLFEDARELGWTDALAAAAGDLGERLGLPLPSELENATRKPMAPVSRPRSDGERVLGELRALSWRGRLALARAIVFPSPTYMKFRYPAHRTAFTRYLKRFWTILTSGAALVGKRARSRLAAVTMSRRAGRTC